MEELPDASDLERVLNPLAHSDQIQAAAILLVGNVCAHQRADSGRIHVGHVGEIQNEGARCIGANLGLKVEECGKDERPGKTQNALSMLWAREIFNDEGLLWHRGILAVGCSEIVTAMLILWLNPPGEERH